MKLYIANGTYVGTQADARAIAKQFTEVDVPTDKAGLIGYLNFIQVDADKSHDLADEFQTVVARQDPAVETVRVVDLDVAFKTAPIAQRIDLAKDLLSDLEAMTTKAEQWIDKPDPRKDAEARQSFAQWEANTADDDEDTEEVVEEDPFA